ncbi:MAG: Bax inhibitor-1 family protein, partial [Planctomycetota bacterium]
EGLLLSIDPVRETLLSVIGGNWWIAFIAFMGVSWLARSWAESDASATTQYLGLGLYIVAEALIFVPLLAIASMFHPDAIPQAGLATAAIFAGLTASVFVTKADFSWMRTGLWIASMAALALMIAGPLFGFSLGLFFTVGMVALMCCYILYDTSNVLHHYRTDQHVAASLALFASLATLFWYVLQLFMASDD